MKIKLIIITLLACISLVNAKAQNTENAENKGKAIIKVFTNFHSGFGKDKNDRGFELERAYLGYKYKMKNGLSITGVTDIGKSSDIDDYHRYVYIKNAMVSWTKKNLTINGGLISTTIFNFQEKFWGNRYLMKSFQDEYKFGSSADLGLSVSYKFAKWITADAIVVNGEGYKKVQFEDGLNYGLGVTLNPVKGFFIRLYGGINEAAGPDEEKNIVNIASFIGYKSDIFRIGAEYNNIQNFKYAKGADLNGISIYSHVNLKKKISVFARYDNLFSKDGWNKENDLSTVTVGTEVKLGKYVKISPNFRVGLPRADGVSESYAGYISCYFGI